MDGTRPAATCRIVLYEVGRWGFNLRNNAWWVRATGKKIKRLQETVKTKNTWMKQPGCGTIGSGGDWGELESTLWREQPPLCSSWLLPFRMQTPWGPFSQRHWKAGFSFQISWLLHADDQFTLLKYTVRVKKRQNKNLQQPHQQPGVYLLYSLWWTIWISNFSLPFRHHPRSFLRDLEAFLYGDFVHL